MASNRMWLPSSLSEARQTTHRNFHLMAMATAVVRRQQLCHQQQCLRKRNNRPTCRT